MGAPVRSLIGNLAASTTGAAAVVLPSHAGPAGVGVVVIEAVSGDIVPIAVVSSSPLAVSSLHRASPSASCEGLMRWP